VACPLAWLGLVLGHDLIGPVWVVPAALLVTLHSSLHHELLHGHPTASRRLNEALGFPALGLFVPYRRFRALHIAHHRDERLTDPYDDPESWYLSADAWQRTGPVTRALLRLNATLAGRVTVGPALALAGFWRSELRLVRADAPGVRRAWCVHALALVPVLCALGVAGVPVLFYAAVVACPAMSVLMVRTFVEHRAAPAVAERTCVVEAGALASLLFLNNNLHAVHHREPWRCWFELPARWRATRAQVLAENGANHVADGYAGVARRWLLRGREPVVHPFPHSPR